MTFGEKVKTLRQRKKLSQSALAELAGVSPRTIFGYEAGTTYPRTEKMLDCLAKALDVDRDDLAGYGFAFTARAVAQQEFSLRTQAQIVTEQMVQMMDNEGLTDEEKADMAEAVLNAYWKSRRKY